MRSCSFTVRGKPQPAGSKRGFYAGGRVVITDANAKSRPWKAMVSDQAIQAIGTDDPIGGALVAYFDFVELRPKGHYNSKQELNAAGLRKPFPTQKPDLLKLARAVEDAMSTIVYRDDSQIVQERLTKSYGDFDGVHVLIEELA